MAEIAQEIFPVNLEDEMRQSYLDYAMSVIVGRALPDVRDGLKPVHRRVLFAMSELGNDWNKAYKKSARVVGDVIGKYHPHGDSAVYDTMVRMAQPFSMRYMLIDGQGNFGSVDGDAPAAMRYTEVRMARIAHEMLADLDKETVDFVPNYDGSEREPVVLPAKVPNLLVNGSSGIAVGMATNIPPHNLGEVIKATIALIDNPELDVNDLMQYLPGPDFPTCGIINGASEIRRAYRSGRGRILVRAKAGIEADEKNGRERIVVTELPYQVNKARLLEKIAELVNEKKIEGISEIRDESDKDGMRVVIELRRGEVSEVILNNLYMQTQMQTVFGINMVALVNGQPKLLSLKEILQAFITHRREVVTRRTIFDLRKARERAHILEGLAVALANIDPVIALIKASANPAEAKAQLIAKTWAPGVVSQMLQKAGADVSRPDDLADEFGLSEKGYRLSEAQAQAILDLRLHRLTGLEQDKIVEEYGELLDRIRSLLEILTNPDRLMQVIRDELNELATQFGDARRTVINADQMDLTVEDLISEENVVVTLSHEGYAKAQPLSDYKTQRRGGRGKTATKMKEEDFVDKLFIANTHDTLLCFSSKGKLYWLKVYELPIASRTSRGKPIVNLLPLEEGERINALLAVREFKEDQFIFMATGDGTVKRTPLSHFSKPRSSGIRAIDIHEGDRLVDVALTDGKQPIMLCSDAGKAIKFEENDVRPMGRTAAGVRGIKLGEGQQVIALIVASEGSVLSVTENGYGKRTPVDQYPLQGRGGQGVVSIQTNERNGKLVGAVRVTEDDEIMLISDGGVLVRTAVRDISEMGRNTQGVRLIRLDEGEKLVEVESIASLSGENDEDDGPPTLPEAIYAGDELDQSANDPESEEDEPA
ncbi:MAG TPA: DNA gyrase subunit A [Gammaproteobacteria bacterium]|nr:DNA gyrase subunit A [Gammaproteobacteria bacterium]